MGCEIDPKPAARPKADSDQHLRQWCSVKVAPTLAALEKNPKAAGADGGGDGDGSFVS